MHWHQPIFFLLHSLTCINRHTRHIHCPHHHHHYHHHHPHHPPPLAPLSLPSPFPLLLPLTPRAMLLSIVAWPSMLGIMAVMDQKDFLAFLNPGSGMCKARIAGITPRYVFPLVVGNPAGRSVWTRRTILQLAGFTGDDTSCAVFSSLFSGPDARHYGRYEPEGLQGGPEADSHILCCSSRPWRFLGCSSTGRSSSRRGAKAVSHGPDCSSDHTHSSVADYGDRRPCCAGRAGFHPVSTLWLSPMVQTAGPWSFPSTWIRWMMSLLSSRTGSHVQVWRRHSSSHGCSSLRTLMVVDIPVFTQCPCCAVVQIPRCRSSSLSRRRDWSPWSF